MDRVAKQKRKRKEGSREKEKRTAAAAARDSLYVCACVWPVSRAVKIFFCNGILSI